MLERQLHLRNKIEQLDFNQVIHDFKEPDPLGDRIGGFWTSTYSETFGCEYLHSGKIFKPYAHVYNGYVFQVNPTVNVFCVSSQEDEYILKEKYNYDFNQLAKRFDCIHVTSDYVRYIRKNRIESNFLFWTCDCTWWFNIEGLQLIEVLDGESIKKFAEVNFIK
ncbi:hypothetical protein [Psychrobacillus sp. FJAT-21963]|uniref:hypothetical protein n=1 Tax=Psychrobacillus sp. FJAT-21963 TaxID=1712028 RepID=UPI0006F4AE0F|nr:hypothetical protein [Psychrobacillus sp. FJAT-21963]KQL37142.1 hypothetical protein AN959_03635 [Psychrobacillus sp. FJAT-21963]